MVDAGLKSEFEKFASKVKTNTNLKADDNQKLKFYGLFKVATSGKYTEENKLKAGLLDFKTKYKNQSWELCSVLSQSEAMAEYIQFYCDLTGDKPSLDISQFRAKTPVDIKLV